MGWPPQQPSYGAPPPAAPYQHPAPTSYGHGAPAYGQPSSHPPYPAPSPAPAPGYGQAAPTGYGAQGNYPPSSYSNPAYAPSSYPPSASHHSSQYGAHAASSSGHPPSQYGAPPPASYAPEDPSPFGTASLQQLLLQKLQTEPPRPAPVPVVAPSFGQWAASADPAVMDKRKQELLRQQEKIHIQKLELQRQKNPRPQDPRDAGRSGPGAARGGPVGTQPPPSSSYQKPAAVYDRNRAPPASIKPSVPPAKSHVPQGRDDRKPIPRRSPPRRRSPPPRRRDPIPKREPKDDLPPPKPLPKYSVRLTPHTNTLRERQIQDLRQRYPRLHISQDFTHLIFNAAGEAPALLDETVPPVVCENDVREEDVPAAASASDANPPTRIWSARVMLMSGQFPPRDATEYSAEKHLSKTIKFLVSKKNRSGLTGIGGPWQPQDGGDPAADDMCLVQTAIRCVKNFCDIDLSVCSEWKKFFTIEYIRPAEVYKGKSYPQQLETIIFFIPNLAAALPSQDAYVSYLTRRFDETTRKLKEERERKIAEREKEKEKETPADGEKKEVETSGETTETLREADIQQHRQVVEEGGDGGKVEVTISIEEMADDPQPEAEPAPAADGAPKELTLPQYLSSFSQTPVLFARTRKAPVPNRVQLISLDGLLDYNEDDKLEKTFEISLFAELYLESLQQHYGQIILNGIRAAEIPTIVEEKRNRDEASVSKSKRARSESTTEVKTEEGKTEAKAEEEKPEKISEEEFESIETEYVKVEKAEADHTETYKIETTFDLDLLTAFRFFDRNECGYLYSDDVEILILNLGLKFSVAQVKSFVTKVAEKNKVYYRKLTDKKNHIWTGIVATPVASAEAEPEPAADASETVADEEITEADADVEVTDVTQE